MDVRVSLPNSKGLLYWSFMAEELEVLWKKLSFTEEEVDDVELGSGNTKVAIERGKYCAC